MLQPVPATAKFSDPVYNIWCGSAVKGDDGKYHMFYSRWPRKLGHYAWVTHSEVAHAVSDSPFGPWTHRDVTLPPRGTNYWDGSCTHNPTVLRIGKKYHLYYMGNYGDGVVRLPLNWEHRNHQRIGVAVADSPDGPWQRFDKPVLETSSDTNAPDALVVTNPSVTERPGGGVLMIYKAVGLKRALPFGGPVVHLAATAENPLGPFTKHPGEVFGAKGVMFAAEDPFIWRGVDRYWAVVKDNDGNFTKRGYSLALWESADGFDWKLAKNSLVATPEVKWADGRMQKMDALERPQLLLENGEPVALLCAAAERKGRDGSFNVQIPIQASKTGELRQSLNGPWGFTTNVQAANWDHITVPGNWDTLPAYSKHKGKGWYRREFVPPMEWQGKHLRLKFDAVYHDAKVTLNGKELGSHNGGYTPFEFDVTSVIKLGATNTVTVCADNAYRRGAWWHWGGISRSVTLIANDDARIVWQHIRAEPDLATGEAKLFVSCRLANTGHQELTVQLTSQLGVAADVSAGRQVTLAPKSVTNVDLVLSLEQPIVRLWHFDHPNLYALRTKLLAGGKVVHEQTDRFGIRKVELTEDSLVLNGERVRLNGYNRVSDSRKCGNTEPDELVKADVDLMKRANGNLTRLMHYPQAPNLLDYLDEKGMMIWCEIPVWGGDDPFVRTNDLSLPRQWMAEMIERDYNHPCIIGWSVGNEMKGHFAYTSNLMAYTRGLDPHRIVSHVSNSGAGPGANRTNDPIKISPLALYNTYSFDKKITDRNAATIVHDKWPEKAVFFSEFGIKQFGGSAEARINGIEEMYRALSEGKPYVIGFSLWTFNDYRSDYQGTPPSGNREWGIVTEDRRPKAAFAQVRKLFSPVHALTVTNGIIRLEPRRSDEVPSFTLRGYKLKWDGGELAVPDLKPGAPTWTCEAHLLPGAVVKLFSPTGYDVADAE